MEDNQIRYYAALELARRDFFQYCKLKAPDFYKPSRAFLVELCNQMQSFYYSDDEVLIINLPPRHGKSRTAVSFVEWILGRNPSEKIITGSYNELLSTGFSKSVRNTILERKGDKGKVVYSDIFPEVRIKKGDGRMNIWSLENGYNNYLATSPDGTATGFGASLLIIDDLIKSAYEAGNADILNKHWEWYTNTLLSRLEEGGKIIIIMTRWHTKDLAGRAIAHYTENEAKVRNVLYRASFEDGSMLCPEILSRKTFESKMKLISREIAEANYNQRPIDLKGKLYSSFKTYENLPVDKNGNLLFEAIRNYTDTADTGNDFLCSINYGVYNKEAYILDVLYTKAGMEITEPLVAKMLFDGMVNIADIESNNGGRGFARNVERLLKERFNSNRVRINTFHQSKNKFSRILSGSSFVMNHIYFPLNWKVKFPEFFSALNEYQKEGRNHHDDAPDAITGVGEILNKEEAFSFL